MRNSTWDSSISPQNSVQCLYLSVFYVYFSAILQSGEETWNCRRLCFSDFLGLAMLRAVTTFQLWFLARVSHQETVLRGQYFYITWKLNPKISVYAARTQRSYPMASCPKVFWITGYKLYLWWASDSLTRFSGKSLLTLSHFLHAIIMAGGWLSLAPLTLPAQRGKRMNTGQDHTFWVA